MCYVRSPPPPPPPSYAREEYFENLVNGHGGQDGLRRDPKVAANWVSNNLFGLLKDKFGRSHGQGDNEDELERYLEEALLFPIASLRIVFLEKLL